MKPKMLLLAKTVPLHDRASGDYRLFQILEILAKDFEIHYLTLQHPLLRKGAPKGGKSLHYLSRDSYFRRDRFDLIEERYHEDLRRIGVKPLQSVEPEHLKIRPTDRVDITPHLAKETYDVVWVEFFYLADEYLADIRRLQPWAKLIVDSVDLHFRRLARQAEYLEKEVRYLVDVNQNRFPPTEEHFQYVREHRRYADHVREQELKVYSRCDAVVVVSDDDREVLLSHLPHLEVLFIPNIHRLPNFSEREIAPLKKRAGSIFVGNFDHNPNITSTIFLKHEVAPAMEAMGSSHPFLLVGSNPPQVVKSMESGGSVPFHITGWVPDTLPWLNKARVSVAPILFGAGMNGKIGEAIAAGVPVVTTHLGAEGMRLRHEEHCLIARTGEEFAHAIQRLHADDHLWYRLQKNARRHLEETFARTPMETALRDAVRSCVDLVKIRRHQSNLKGLRPARQKAWNFPAARFKVEKQVPDVSVVVLSHNHWQVTELCLKSLAWSQKKNPKLRMEVILVDNASRDETVKNARRIPGLRVVANKKNLGFAAGNNAGIRASRGQYVILLNNDTVVSPDWLKKLVAHAQRIPDLGVMGPATNTEIGQALHGARYENLREFFAWNDRLNREANGSWDLAEKVSGLCLFIPRSTLVKVGILDTVYGIGYFEDDDYCLRVKEAGLKLVWAKDVYVHHFGSVSFEHNSIEKWKHLEHGMSQFIFKWGKRGLDHIAKAHQENLLRPSQQEPQVAW